MGALDLSVQVHNISPRASKEDLITFFSYCGTIDEIQLQRDGDQSQLAVVTFIQPYAFQTALLLNDAVIVDRRVCILPLENGSVPIIVCTSENKQIEDPATQSAAQAGCGHEMLSKVTGRASYVGKTLTIQANMVISAAEQTMGSIGSAISNNSYFTKSTAWISNVLDRASKNTVQLGNANAKARNSNSSKQK